MRTRVKICGITRPEDGLAAVRYGADAIGLVFFEQSPRAVDIDTARAIVREIPPFVTVTGLFVNPTEEYVQDVLNKVSVDLLQFHGAEDQSFCAGFGRRYIKALSMQAPSMKENTGQDQVNPVEYARQYPDAVGILFDSYHPDLHGGTGKTFDWDAIPADFKVPMILAGGLDAGNVADAIRQVRPYAVDVSSGVELEKGIKDEKKIVDFMREVSLAQKGL
ncbi:MAG: phosphoribosylanthranilate isomerase [Gammaproteobacteria bacterium]|nr:phosphoribosylanthranilate isomerase [Gammaproteobacteria bacterium]